MKTCEYLNTNISLVLTLIILLQLLNISRKRNNTQVFNASGNIYYNHFYVTFWLASKVLGYRKVQLAGVPIGMQFKLVLRGTFAETVEDVWNSHYEDLVVDTTGESSVEIEVKEINMDSWEESPDVNLFICDTYPIKLNQISKEFQENPTIVINSVGDSKQLRYINKPLVNEVRKSVQSIARDKNLYVFSTANPKNNLNIITSCFRFFDRFPIKNAYVVQFGKDKKYRKAIKIL